MEEEAEDEDVDVDADALGLSQEDVDTGGSWRRRSGSDGVGVAGRADSPDRADGPRRDSRRFRTAAPPALGIRR